MTNQERFCEKCGINLGDNARFCPSCGFRIPGRNQEEIAKEKEMIRETAHIRSKWAGYLMLIYSLPLLVLGIYYFADAGGLASTLWNNPTTNQQFVEWGLVYDDIVKYLQYFGIGWLVTGISGIASAVLCIKRQHYYIALFLCIVSVLFSVTGFFTLIIGLIAFWFVISSAIGFKENEEKLEKILENYE